MLNQLPNPRISAMGIFASRNGVSGRAFENYQGLLFGMSRPTM